MTKTEVLESIFNLYVEGLKGANPQEIDEKIAGFISEFSPFPSNQHLQLICGLKWLREEVAIIYRGKGTLLYIKEIII